MENIFSIQFLFELIEGRSSILIAADVKQLPGYCRFYIYAFQLADKIKTSDSILPSIQIRRTVIDNEPTWIHEDSERESLLSRQIGRLVDTYVVC